MANGGAEAVDLLESLGVAAVDASAVEKDLWAQVSDYTSMFSCSACGVLRAFAGKMQCLTCVCVCTCAGPGNKWSRCKYRRGCCRCASYLDEDTKPTIKLCKDPLCAPFSKFWGKALRHLNRPYKARSAFTPPAENDKATTWYICNNELVHLLPSDGGKVRRVEQRLRTVEREIDAVLAALDSLADTEAAAAGDLGAGNASSAPEPCGLGSPPEAQAVLTLPADRPPAVEQRAHGAAVGGVTSAAVEVEKRGVAAAGSSPAGADAEEQGAAEQGLQAAVLRQRLVDLEAQQRRLQVPGRPSTVIHELVW